MEPGVAVAASAERVDHICQAFAQVIDAKSHYTYSHSIGVASAAVEIAEALNLAPQTITMVRRAALLHDIGKLSVSNAILEKPGKLTDQEWEAVRMHPVYTRLILRMITGFEHLAFIAAAHHERLDGKGYPENLDGDNLPLTARILCVADVYQALSEKRPYREGLEDEVVFGIMEKDAPTRLDPKCLDALKQNSGSTAAEGVSEANDKAQAASI
jgi:putative nucleotidyltransferase with HDIG domain